MIQRSMLGGNTQQMITEQFLMSKLKIKTDHDASDTVYHKTEGSRSCVECIKQIQLVPDGLYFMALTFFIIMVDYCILYLVRKLEINFVVFSLLTFSPVCILFLQSLFSLIVSLDLVAAHTSHQTLTLAQRKRLQQALVNFHVM